MNIVNNQDLRPYNTFGIAAQARLWAVVRNFSDLHALLKLPEWHKLPRLILGGGSNILLSGNFDGLVVKMDMKGISVLESSENEVVVKVGAGEVWHDWVMHALAQGWGGLENLSLIPGSVGASPIQNIGAYGVELKDVCAFVEVANLLTGEISTLPPEKCEFGYRDSIFKRQYKDQYLITAVGFRLTLKNHRLDTSYGAISQTLAEWGIAAPSIAEVGRAVVAIRQSKLPDPARIGNCGSFFKNPEIPHAQYEALREKYPTLVAYPQPNGLVKVPAGWLIEQCGWKGKRVGNVGAYEKQALVLVNHGNATGAEAVALAKAIQQSVHEKFGIAIQPEVNII